MPDPAPARATCPTCGTPGMTPFYHMTGAPVHSVLLLPTREEAVNYTTGNITLARCEHCGFVANIDYDPGLQEYSSRYEATQSYSPTFSAFSRRLATSLVEKHDLRSKRILEIGCGQGEFLTELCEIGGNRGIGFDPAYIPERSPANTDLIEFKADFYSEKYTGVEADFFVCKMTLEHIGPTGDFIGTVRRAIADQTGSTVFFQIPNATRVFQDLAFWDIYYEHCSYFSRASLDVLFRRNGFDVLDIWTDYDDQYLMIDARPSTAGAASDIAPDPAALAEINGALDHFIAEHPARLQSWRDTIQTLHRDGKKVVIWGGGSKGVAFLTTLDIRDEIAYAVDINPHKNGMYMAGTGQQTVLPQFLLDYRPDAVIVMNPIYCDEIQHTLDELGVAADLLPLEG